MDPNFIEIGHRPLTQVKGALDENTFRNPSAEDRIHFFKSEGCVISELQRVIHSTVLVSETPDYPGGSGVIITFDGKKYVITATHVIGDLVAGQYGKPELKYYYRDTHGQVKEGIMSRGNILYDSTTARERDLQATDAAIFPFDGDNEGVEISDQEVPTENSQVAVAVGYPGEHQDGWKDTGKPLLSVGRMFRDKPKEMTPYMRELMAKYMKESGEKEGVDLKVNFTGRVIPGNSGGPLVDVAGKVVGVCHGPRGTLGKEDGIERFSDFRAILRQMSSPS
ncbi:MAG: hypothetical protein A3F61_00150 [Candidatus Blackburnbacteria bacterium RIFCSPHIGHO2_12_FULL_41_13b]|uniref:Serine protease n=1 Tax=Candidatus Blackburnbacteria bacterium RIFCSPHIGHO2_12_FULL_41_13b TaxID=1797517 RepID=A0A1G1V7T6_9BACT|nr:MAG: hypothetical protein A3F61_00150 [Candidatus Blackburnbacteria bacterium RIFCSPHIGHO2_12_FULL_41_13b]